jgi:hypothetical protein
MWRKKRVGKQSAEQQAAADLVRLATEQGLSLSWKDVVVPKPYPRIP